MASASKSLQMSGDEQQYLQDSGTSDRSPPRTIGCQCPVEQGCGWKYEMRSQPQRTAPHHQATADHRAEVEVILLSPGESVAGEAATPRQQNWWDDEPITPSGGPMAEAVLIFDLCDEQSQSDSAVWVEAEMEHLFSPRSPGP